MVAETQGQYIYQTVYSSICHTMYTVTKDVEGSWAGLCQCGSFVMFCAPNARIIKVHDKEELRKIRFVVVLVYHKGNELGS